MHTATDRSTQNCPSNSSNTDKDQHRTDHIELNKSDFSLHEQRDISDLQLTTPPAQRPNGTHKEYPMIASNRCCMWTLLLFITGLDGIYEIFTIFTIFAGKQYCEYDNDITK